MCLGNLSPIASRTSSSDLPSCPLAAAKPRIRHCLDIPHNERGMWQLLEEIVRSQHQRSFSLDWPFEELTRCSLFNRIAQPDKLIYSLICLHITLAFKIVHRRSADRTPNCIALI